MKRNKVGQFAASLKTQLKRATLWSASVAVSAGILASILSTSTVSANLPEKEVVDNTPEKIAVLKADVITRLAQCESAGHSEDYGLITWDNNAAGTLSARNIPSVGNLQFKVTTVQRYHKERTREELTGKEALLLALDYDRAADLATWIIFETQGGIWNWKNCSDKLGLSAEVTIIKKLSR